MNFTEHYSELQQKQTNLVNAEIEFYNLGPEDYTCGFNLEDVKTVLAGKSPINPKKIINAIWELCFGDCDPKAFSEECGFTEVYKDDDKLMVARIKKRMRENDLKGQGITSADLARKMSRTAGFVSQLLNGKYTANPTQHLHDIYAHVSPIDTNEVEVTNIAEEERIRLRYGEYPFVETSISKTINVSCQQARERRRVSVFAGQAGLGKSMAAKQYAEQHSDDTILIEGSELTTVTEILETLCIALSITPKTSGSRNVKAICKALRGSDKLIILDEADKCKPNSLDPLRTISDQAYVGVMLIGNLELDELIQTNPRYNLIRSRVSFFYKPLGEVPVDDLKSIFYGLTKNTVPVEDDSDTFWNWLHKRVEGNARTLGDNLIPHVLTQFYKYPERKFNQTMVNQILTTYLNKPY
ncbi:AAA family ATPase [Pseudoalteromonas luteoviolacea]|uniref:AAA family ATPase n=1 Tax=Pseudoalteromonas luteoviolacea TaxID=43657 RepID=UPI001B3A657F|nr:AAA family ATPase [Pseudoalteromonas luteoviolacea]MBQ4879658.1 AAA family ATPase [Pseudoalteromonas luteoviolacea]MBQ4908668.1 AAA family ATPase [Pseudoalteromonas luteoviolacea]